MKEGHPNFGCPSFIYYLCGYSRLLERGGGWQEVEPVKMKRIETCRFFAHGGFFVRRGREEFPTEVCLRLLQDMFCRFSQMDAVPPFVSTVGRRCGVRSGCTLALTVGGSRFVKEAGSDSVRENSILSGGPIQTVKFPSPKPDEHRDNDDDDPVVVPCLREVQVQHREERPRHAAAPTFDAEEISEQTDAVSLVDPVPGNQIEYERQRQTECEKAFIC